MLGDYSGGALLHNASELYDPDCKRGSSTRQRNHSPSTQEKKYLLVNTYWFDLMTKYIKEVLKGDDATAVAITRCERAVVSGSYKSASSFALYFYNNKVDFEKFKSLLDSS